MGEATRPACFWYLFCHPLARSALLVDVSYGLQVETTSRTLLLKAHSSMEMHAWIEGLRNVMQEKVSVGSSKAEMKGKQAPTPKTQKDSKALVKHYSEDSESDTPAGKFAAFKKAAGKLKNKLKRKKGQSQAKVGGLAKSEDSNAEASIVSSKVVEKEPKETLFQIPQNKLADDMPEPNNKMGEFDNGQDRAELPLPPKTAASPPKTAVVPEKSVSQSLSGSRSKNVGLHESWTPSPVIKMR